MYNTGSVYSIWIFQQMEKFSDSDDEKPQKRTRNPSRRAASNFREMISFRTNVSLFLTLITAGAVAYTMYQSIHNAEVIRILPNNATVQAIIDAMPVTGLTSGETIALILSILENTGLSASINATVLADFLIENGLITAYSYTCDTECRIGNDYSKSVPSAITDYCYVSNRHNCAYGYFCNSTGNCELAYPRPCLTHADCPLTELGPAVIALGFDNSSYQWSACMDLSTFLCTNTSVGVAGICMSYTVSYSVGPPYAIPAVCIQNTLVGNGYVQDTCFSGLPPGGTFPYIDITACDLGATETCAGITGLSCTDPLSDCSITGEICNTYP